MSIYVGGKGIKKIKEIINIKFRIKITSKNKEENLVRVGFLKYVVMFHF